MTLSSFCRTVPLPLAGGARGGPEPTPSPPVSQARPRPLPQAGGESGFTLVELLVVIVIIGLLATIVAINVIPAGEKAAVEKAKADIATLEQAVEMYRLDNLAYPATTDGLQALVSPPPSLAQPARYRRGGYVKRLPNDPWGRPYYYAAPGRSGPFDIYTLGADGQEGGEDENADIGNWQ